MTEGERNDGIASTLFAGSGDMPRRMRACDWSQTALGAATTWPASLRSALSICLGSRFPIAIYWGPELVLLYNDAWSPIAGSKHPWALGRPAIEVWPEIWSDIGPAFEQVITTGEATYNEELALFMHRHGYTEECWFSYTFTPIRGETGAVEGIFNAVIETTFKVIAERRTRVLRDLAERLAGARSAEEACSIAAEVLGTDGHDAPFCAFYLADEAFVEARLASSAGMPVPCPALPATVSLEAASSSVLGMASLSPRTEVVGDLDRRFGALIAGPWPEPVTSALVAPILPGTSSRPAGFLVLGVSPRRAVDDEYRQFVERAAGQVASAIANATALAAERKRAEELAALDRAKTAFFSNVSHELRTPLTLILGPLQDLLAGAWGPLSADQRALLEMQQRNGVRLQKLVNSLLELSRLEAGRVPASYEAVDLTAVTRELGEAFRVAVERAGLRLRLELAPIAEPVFVDRDMWEKVVLNLLSNALKFTFDGEIEMSLRSSRGHAVLAIRDTGTGIAENELPRLFDRFHRVEGARSRTHEGSGIGLALVQELVRLHGGAVDVTSTVGAGSTFTVTLPTGADHLPAAPPLAARAPSTALGAAPFVEEALGWLPGQRSASDSLPPPLSDPPRDAPALATRAHHAARILVADDNADMREYIRQHLARDWNVEVAGDGLEALAAARANPPDLILTDVMMPGLDGFALLRELRSDARTGAIPVLMLSARAGDEARVQGVEAGVEDYLVKPFSARELLARVRTHLEIAHLRKAVEAERDQLRSLLGQVPAIVNFLRGPDLVIEYAHPRTIATLGGRDVQGRPLLDAIPEFAEQEYPTLLRQVLATGERAEGRERPVRLVTADGRTSETYWNFVYLPVRDERGDVDGVMTFDIDVTDQVLARRRVEESEEQFRRLVQQVGAGIAETDLTGRFTLTNARYQAIVGRTAEELAGLRMQDITHPEDLPGNLARFAELVERGTPFAIEKRYVRPDGTVVWVQNNVARLDDRDGRPHGVAAVTLDITERRALEEHARFVSDRFATVQRAATVGIFDWDLASNVVHWSDELFALLGLAIGEVTPSTDEWTTRLHPADRDGGWAAFQAATAARLATFETELRVQLPTGALRWLRMSNQIFYDGAGRPVRLVGSAIDIQELKEAVERERGARERAEAAARFSDMFVGILGHDLRNPLSAITAAAHLVSNRAESERISTPVARIMTSADRMERMIAQLLDLTMIRLGRGLPLSLSRVDLAALCRVIIEEIEQVHRCPIEIGSIGDVTGMWDRDRLQQLVANLAANACQHRTPGSPVRLQIDGTASDRVRLEIHNSGVIPPELVPVIFEPLRTTQRAARRGGASGLGLGLFITQQITLAHGGAIQVTSDEQRGTSFTVDLPRWPVGANEGTS